MYIEKGGQRLRRGYTTGSCAAAAAKAAAIMLLSGREVHQVRITTPKGISLLLEINDISFRRVDGKIHAVSCAVRKDSGDDPDVTNGTLIYAETAVSDIPGIRIDGGEGVGRVTKPGLDQPVGNAAINSTPRRMIEEAVREILDRASKEGTRDHLQEEAGDHLEAETGDHLQEEAGDHLQEEAGDHPQAEAGDHPQADPPAAAWSGIPAPRGLEVIISVPGGDVLARKTFNPKLGIRGGISILGTSGIVEPMSDDALLATIRVEINVRKKEGLTILPAAPGNYGRSFFMEKYGFSLDTAVESSNFIFDTVRMVVDAGFSKMLFIGHIGKLVKVAGGIRNTHSRYGDHRMEILGRIAEDLARRGDLPASGCAVIPSLLGELDGCVATDEAIRILQKYDLDRPVLAEMTRRIQSVMEGWAEGTMKIEVIVFSNVFGVLGITEQAEDYILQLRHM